MRSPLTPLQPAGTRAVIAGGGTGGHVYPGLAVAEALVRKGVRRADVHFVVSRRALDADAVTEAGFAATPVHARGLQRKLAPANLVAAAALARGALQCWRLLGRISPQVVLAQGGYVSAACALAARLRRTPIVVLEANATAGLANRVAARWAAACAVGFPATALPRRTVTGLPVRDAIATLHPARANEAAATVLRREARATLDVGPERRLVLVIGGSQGSARLNAATGEACRLLTGRDDLALRHVVGNSAAAARTALAGEERADRLQYQAVTYERDMSTALAAADLVVSRAGGSTIAELATVGRAAVLVPLPGATGDHQTANAAALASTGGAAVVPDAELDGARLAGLISDLLADPEGLARMERAAATLGAPRAADDVADMLLGFAGARGGS